MSCFLLSLSLTNLYQVLAVNTVPPLRRRFLPYGSRTVAQQNVQLSPKGSLSAFLDCLATLQVPHRYFTHFYVVSEILRNGHLLSAIAALAPKIDPSKAMTKEQILLTCGSCIGFLGWAFYAGVGLAVWVEGIQQMSRHLASLKKYSLPTQPFFRYITCYTAECLIYLSLAGIAAPPGQIFNKTILAALVFVAVNLGVTAETTRQWYVEKFGEDKVTALWRIIPFVY
ncbi:hypothetical protein F5146DRAFT_1101577 [Armillaria mellea]|nr:hypothetical protein F5146DRAFT_1101577 [Armillaria mellea]